jgi:hypothetical protein
MNQLTEKTIEHLRQELAGAEVESKAKNALLDSYNTLLIAEREKCQRLRDALDRAERQRDELFKLMQHQSHCESMKRANVPMEMCTCWKRAYVAALERERMEAAALSDTSEERGNEHLKSRHERWCKKQTHLELCNCGFDDQLAAATE